MQRLLMAAAVAVGLLAAWSGGAASAWGQGVLVVINPPHPIPLPRPRPTPPPMSYQIKELDYRAKVVDQVAEIAVTQSFVNTGSRAMEVEFVFPIPPEAVIDRMTLLVDGKEYDAQLLPAKDAREIYERHVRRNQDPALLEWLGHGMFKTSVFPVPPGAERKVSLRYSQLLRQDRQLTDLLLPLATAKYTSAPVEKLAIRVAIETARELKSIYSPTHSVNIDRPDKRHAVVKFEAANTVPTADFRLLFDTADSKLGASLLSYRPEKDEPGYFLLLASPRIKAPDSERPAKTVIFVVDRSGSMSGKKIEQAKEALKFVLNNLRDGDTFNIVAYDTTVESFRPELQKYDAESRQAALGFVEGLYAGGSTNIDEALGTALDMIHDDRRPSYVLFLTDGLPTAGETNETKIAARATERNHHRTRMINFGVGYDVNSRLLDRLSRDNFGQSAYVRPDEDIEAHVAALQSKLGAPVLTDVKVAFDVDGHQGAVVNRVYPKEVFDLFAGDQLVLVGRYREPGDAKITISGRVGGERETFDFPGELVERTSGSGRAFVARLWAMRRIGEIIDEIDLKGKNEELVQELVDLSTKYGILTPYTSFLADETSSVRELADTRLSLERTEKEVERLSAAGGVAGFSQRADKYALQQAELAPAASAPAFGVAAVPDAGLAGPAASGLAGGGAAAGRYAGRSRAANVYRKIDSDEAMLATGVQNAGNETLFKRGDLWIANSAKNLDPEKDAAKIKQIARFSDDYFQLLKDNTDTENAILAAQQPGERLLLVLRGQAYEIR